MLFVVLFICGCVHSVDDKWNEEEVFPLIINDRLFLLLNGQVSNLHIEEFVVNRGRGEELLKNSDRTFNFSMNGSLIEEVYVEGLHETYNEYLMDEIGVLKKVETTFDLEKRLLMEYEQISEKKVKVIHFLVDSSIYCIDIIHFDEFCNVKMKNTNGLESFQPSSSVFYYYNNENNELIKEVVHYEDSKGLDSTVKCFYRDSSIVKSYFEGRVISKKEDLFKSKDERGNWIVGKRNWYLNNMKDTLRYVFKRELKYYE